MVYPTLSLSPHQRIIYRDILMPPLKTTVARQVYSIVVELAPQRVQSYFSRLARPRQSLPPFVRAIKRARVSLELTGDRDEPLLLPLHVLRPAHVTSVLVSAPRLAQLRLFDYEKSCEDKKIIGNLITLRRRRDGGKRGKTLVYYFSKCFGRSPLFASFYTALMIVNYINSAVKSLAIDVGWWIFARSRSADVDKGLARAKFPRCDEESKVNQLRLFLIVPSICRERKRSLWLPHILSWTWYNVGRISLWTVNASSSGGLCAPSTFASVRYYYYHHLYLICTIVS